MDSRIPVWKELTRLFTVVCQFDESGRIVQASDLFANRCQLSTDNLGNFFELFRFKRPSGFTGDFESACEYAGNLILAYSESVGFAVRGQFLDYRAYGLDGLYFVGVPWLWWMESNVSSHDLTLADFPIIDVQMDQLFFMTIQQRMVDDLQEVNDELTRAKGQLEEANASRQKYFNHVSHEMRSPLSGVISALTLLSDEDLQGRSRDLIDLASKSASRLLEVINFTLENATLDSGGSAAEDQVFDLDDLLDECLMLGRAKAIEKNLELLRIGHQSFSHLYLGKARLIKQVLTNLLGNALKFSVEGSISLEVNLISSRNDNVDVIAFAVRDEGPGIPSDALGMLFKPFATGLSEATRSEQGTGLGLSIVKRFVEILGGEIQVESTMGEGAAFSFEVALTRSLEHDKKPARRSHVADHAYRIIGRLLLVDDLETNLLLNARIFESLGLTVVTANGGGKAVEIVRNDPSAFDVVMMDLEMPDVDGYEATQLIRQIPGTENLPILALSAHVGNSVRKRALATGMNSFLPKPIVRSELIGELQDWLRIERLETEPENVTVNAKTLLEASGQGSDVHNAESSATSHSASASEDRGEDMATTESASQFDAEKIHALVKEVGVDVTETLVRKFLEESAGRWEQLTQAMTADENPAVIRESHTLGSACLTFGIDAAGQKFREIERDAQDQKPVPVSLLQPIGGLLGDGIRQLETYLAELKASS